MDRNERKHLGGAWSLVRIQSPRQLVNNGKSMTYKTDKPKRQENLSKVTLQFGCIWLHLVAKIVQDLCRISEGRRKP